MEISHPACNAVARRAGTLEVMQAVYRLPEPAHKTKEMA